MIKLKDIRKKLHNRSGASLSYALLFLLVATMVSMVIINASVTSAKSVQNERDSRQAQLTLNSAAKLIREELYGTTVRYESVVNKKNGAVESTEDRGIVSDLDTGMAKLLKPATDQLRSGVASSYSSPADIVLTISGDSGMAETMLLGSSGISMAYTLTENTESGSIGATSEVKAYDLNMTLKLTSEDGVD
ncbi:MAG: hypothetical protein J6N76_04505, partial [Lachnospiraceae bacterium]|nr:hypothetical protein [Lachnospiraceae bacterium]